MMLDDGADLKLLEEPTLTNKLRSYVEELSDILARDKKDGQEMGGDDIIKFFKIQIDLRLLLSESLEHLLADANCEI